MKQFSELPLRAEIIEAIGKAGFATATEVQEAAIPVAVSGKDVIVRAKTGTGKTLAFLLPIMQGIHGSSALSAIVILPTRELAVQVATVAEQIGRHLHLKTVMVYGGASINVQLDQLHRGANIVVGTPGRILDLISRGALKLQHVKFVVLDEADRMLDMGFIDDIKEILLETPVERQTMLFSAIMPAEIGDIARHYMKPDHAKIIVGKEEEIVVNTIKHMYMFAQGRMKFGAMLAYIDKFAPKKCIIFSRTKHESETIHKVLIAQGLDATLLHGGLTQAKREHSLRKFREGARFLIATDVAARGLDIANITDIINFDAPDGIQNYVNRVGRSARMGKEGRAFTLIAQDEKELMGAIQYEANISIEELRLDTAKYRSIELPQRSRGRFGDRGGNFRSGPREGGYGHGPSRGGYGGGDRGGRPNSRYGSGNRSSYHSDRRDSGSGGESGSWYHSTSRRRSPRN